MTTDQKNYEAMHRVSKEVRVLKGISSLLDWDHETYMPEDGVIIRSEQLKVMAGLIHQKSTSPSYARTLNKLIDIESGTIYASSLSKQQKAALKEWRRDYIQEKALPKIFVQDFAKLTSQAIQVWKHARERNQFHSFAPYLEKIVQMNKKKADYLGYNEHPYDALLDHYEPEMKTAEVLKLFSHLKKSIQEIVKQVANEQSEDDFLFGKFDPDTQIKFSHLLLNKLNYDLKKGRLDLSAHPFSSASHPCDSRITTRIHASSLMSNISAVLHEAGHALYEMGLPVEHYGTPLGDAISLGVHESQSRWWETFIGHSKSFWQFFLPELKTHFPQLKSISLDQFYKALNKVKPSFIRIEADEVTYSLHVILRFELEKQLIEGSLSIRDLPEAWQTKMEELLGIKPTTFKEGCLQDIHWSMGAFGYFPTYTLGNLYAGQLFEKFGKEHPNWQTRVSQGELLFIKEWLNKSVYQHGRSMTSKELIHHVTGKPFSADAYISYLKQKFC